MTLGILYHMPFWQTADGGLWEAEGSFARYVDSLAPYFDEVVLSVPVFDAPPGSGTRVTAANVRLAPLPYFPGPRQFYPMLLAVRARLRAWVQQCDVVHLRVPTPAGYFAHRIAERLRRPVFLLVVGDYRALRPHLPYRGVKKLLFGAYVAFEEWALERMVRSALTFTNGAALRAKHERQGTRVYETRTSTLRLGDVATRTDTCRGTPIRLFTVSRIDPRKGLRVLPDVVARLAASGIDAVLDLVGPPIGQVGETERQAVCDRAAALGVASRVRLLGAVPLEDLMPLYRQYDIFVLPTGPGEGIPRVLLEAMAAGLPVVTTPVAGITSLVADGDNGLLVAEATAERIGDAIAALIASPALRQRLIQRGYETARAHTVERQAAEMMRVAARELRLSLKQPAAVPAA